jgi:hypothetical protein
MQVDPDAILPIILQQQPPALEPKRAPPPLPPPRRGTTPQPPFFFRELKLTLVSVGSAGSSVEAPSGQMSISVKFSVVTPPLVLQLLSLFVMSCLRCRMHATRYCRCLASPLLQVYDTECAVCLGSDASSRALKMRTVLLVQARTAAAACNFCEVTHCVAAGQQPAPRRHSLPLSGAYSLPDPEPDLNLNFR